MSRIVARIAIVTALALAPHGVPAQIEGVRTDRLPQILPEAAGEAGPRATMPPRDADLPPVRRGVARPESGPVGAFAENAVPFAGSGALVSIVVVDTGSDPVDLAMPLAVALDAARPEIAARAAAYRARGYEVLVMPAIPANGTPQDVEQALQASLRMIGGAVAILPDPESRRSRATLATLIGRLAETGQGVLGHPGGLDLAGPIARARDVPAATAGAEIDNPDATSEDVARSLARAAASLGPDDARILLARNRPGTLAALAGARLPEGTRFAPLTAAMRRQQDTR